MDYPESNTQSQTRHGESNVMPSPRDSIGRETSRSFNKDTIGKDINRDMVREKDQWSKSQQTGLKQQNAGSQNGPGRVISTTNHGAANVSSSEYQTKEQEKMADAASKSAAMHYEVPESNEEIIASIKKTSVQNLDLFAQINMQKTRMCHYPEYRFKTNISPTDAPPTFEVEEHYVSRSVETRLNYWTIPRSFEPAIKNVPYETFNTRTDFSASNYIELEKLNSAQMAESSKYLFFEDNRQITESLKTLLHNAHVIQLHLENIVKTLTADSPSRILEIQTQVVNLNRAIDQFRRPDVKFIDFVPSQLLQLRGFSMTHFSFLQQAIAKSLGTTLNHLKPPVLRFQASRDGFTGKEFHHQCDNVPNLLIVIQTHTKYLFGAFTTVPFQASANGVFSRDPNSFLFTLTNPHDIEPTLLPSTGDEKAVFSVTNYGPIFGGSHDLLISENCNTDGKSYFNPKSSFSDPTGKGFRLFTGEQKFQVEDFLAYTFQ